MEPDMPDKEEKTDKPQKRLKLRKPTSPCYEIHRDDNLAGTKKPLREACEKPDGRSPNIKSVFVKKYPNTGGEHPRIRRIRNQLAEIVKNKVKTVPLKQTRIAAPFRMHEDVETKGVLLEDAVSVIKDLLAERATAGYTTSRWNRPRSGKLRPVRPGNRPERMMVKALKHAAKSADIEGRSKRADREDKMRMQKASFDQKQATSLLARIA
jgi:hypothetical protein